MNKEIDYIIHTNLDNSIVTLNDFVKDFGSIGYGIDLNILINYKDENGVSNVDKIDRSIYLEDRENYDLYNNIIANIKNSTSSEIGKLPFRIGVSICIPYNLIDRTIGVTESNQLVKTIDYESFLAKKLYDLLKDTGYKKIYQTKNNEIVKNIFSKISVWVWSRANSKRIDEGFDDKLINLTPFVSSLNTFVSSSGGNFNIQLSPLIANYLNGEWNINSNYLSIRREEIISHYFHNFKDENNNIIRNNNFFDRILQNNDLVFIKFEKLELEKSRNEYDSNLEISINALPNQIFDMIGLIDNVNINYSALQNNIDINVNGRDLIKLFIEDGVYFYPMQFIKDGIFANSVGATNEHLLRFNGQIASRFQSFNKTIATTLKFIINALSNIQITSNNLFDAYEDKRSYAYQLTDDSVDRQSVIDKENENKREDIYKEIKLSLLKDKLYNSDAIINSIFQQLITFCGELIDSKKSIEIDDELVGWESTTHKSQTLAKNQLPAELDALLYKQKTSWRDDKGRLITDQEYNQLISDIEKQEEKINKELPQILRTDKISEKIRADKSQKELDRLEEANSYEEADPVLISLRERNLESLGKFAFPESTLPISGNFLATLSDTQKEQKIQYDLLIGRYNSLKNQKGKIFLCQIPQYFDSNINSNAKKAIQETYKLLKDIRRNKEPIIRENLPVRGIWQIIKLVVDDSVANRRIVDPTIGNEHGSLINAINKICQQPFVEFSTDTYGDQFYLIVRKKPFDKKSIQNYLKSFIQIEKNLEDKKFSNSQKQIVGTINEIEKQQSQSIIIDINEEDIINEQLTFSNDAYSWYKIEPKNLITGNDSSMALAYLKAVFFPEYAEIFGSKPLDIQTNYINYFPVNEKNENINVGNIIQQAIYDLKYLIESHAYLPFTRQGSILINGDRRIKRGTFIRLKSTKEIFYVDSVNNSFNQSDSSIDRVTNLSISRGMVEDYINGIEIGGVVYSYFDLINLDIPESLFNNPSIDINQKILSQWKVNKTIFNFFVKRLQFVNINILKNELASIRKPIDNNIV